MPAHSPQGSGGHPAGCPQTSKGGRQAKVCHRRPGTGREMVLLHPVRLTHTGKGCTQTGSHPALPGNWENFPLSVWTCPCPGCTWSPTEPPLPIP